MSCTIASERLTGLAVGEAGAEEAVLREHVARCADCRAELDELETALAAIRAVDEPEPLPSDVYIRKIVRAADARRRRWMVPSSLAAALLMGGTVGFFLLKQKPQYEGGTLSGRELERYGSRATTSRNVTRQRPQGGADPAVGAEATGPSGEASGPAPEGRSTRGQAADALSPFPSEAKLVERPPSALRRGGNRGEAASDTPAAANDPYSPDFSAAIIGNYLCDGLVVASAPYAGYDVTDLGEVLYGDAPAAPLALPPAAPPKAGEAIAERLPTGRTFTPAQPGKPSSSGTAAPVTVYGATSAENQYLIDGLNVTSVDASKNMNMEFIEEVDVAREIQIVDAGRDAGESLRRSFNQGVRAKPEPTPQQLEASRKLQSLGYLSEGSFTTGADYVFQPKQSPAEPDAMYFKPQKVSPWQSTQEERTSTFGMDVDTASYTLARSYLMRNQLPPPEAIRTEEFVNALVVESAPSQRGFTIDVDGAPSPFEPAHSFVRIAVHAPRVAETERKRANLTFVVDVSGSMAREDRLGLVKEGLRTLVDRLDRSDSIGLVVYGTTAHVVMEPTPASRREEILAAIDRLVPEGATNLAGGLDLGYAMAQRGFERRATNRVILCTDGVANNGTTDADTLVARIREWAGKDIELSALGFGMGNYNDALLQRLADEGDGRYAYLDDRKETAEFFEKDLAGLLQTVAKDAKIQVEMNPEVVSSWRLLGYEKRELAERDFRNDSVDAGEVNSGDSVTALYEVVLRRPIGRIGTVRLRYREPDSRNVVERDAPVATDRFAPTFFQATESYRVAVVAARFAEVLRGGAEAGDFRRLEEAAASIRTAGRGSRELADLVARAARISGDRVRRGRGSQR